MGDLALQHHGRQISGEDDADSGDNTLLIQVGVEPSWEKVSQGKFSLSSRKVQQPNGGGGKHDRQLVRLDVAGITWPWRASGK